MSINLPEGHAFPIPIREAKASLNEIRSSGTHEIGLELPDLCHQQQSPSIMFCYKFPNWAIALYVENSSDLVFQHYDERIARVREARIYLLDNDLPPGVGRIRVTWDQDLITLGIADEQYKVIDQSEGR